MQNGYVRTIECYINTIGINEKILAEYSS